MMPFIQGDPSSVPLKYSAGYEDIIQDTYFEKGKIGFLTIDESRARKGSPHRGARSKTNRALHTEAGKLPGKIYAWGSGGRGPTRGPGLSHNVTLDRGSQVLLANNLNDSCALWDATHEDTSADGDIGHLSNMYPMSDALLMKAGEVHRIGILTPHESLPVTDDTDRQFLRIVSSGVNGREPYFTLNPLLNA